MGGMQPAPDPCWACTSFTCGVGAKDAAVQAFVGLCVAVGSPAVRGGGVTAQPVQTQVGGSKLVWAAVSGCIVPVLFSLLQWARANGGD